MIKNKILMSSILVSVIGLTAAFSVEQQVENVQQASGYNALNTREITNGNDVAGVNTTFDKYYNEAPGTTDEEKIAYAKEQMTIADPTRTKKIGMNNDNFDLVASDDTNGTYNIKWNTFKKGQGLDFDPSALNPGQFMQQTQVSGTYGNNANQIANPKFSSWIYFDEVKIGSESVTFTINKDKTNLPDLTGYNTFYSKTVSEGGTLQSDPVAYYSKYYPDSINPEFGTSAAYKDMYWESGKKGSSYGIGSQYGIAGTESTGWVRFANKYFDWTVDENGKRRQPTFKENYTFTINNLEPKSVYSINLDLDFVKVDDGSGTMDNSGFYQIEQRIVFKTANTIRSIRTEDADASVMAEEKNKGKLTVEIPSVLLYPYYTTESNSLYDSPNKIESVQINNTINGKSIDLADPTYWIDGNDMYDDAGSHYGWENGDTESIGDPAMTTSLTPEFPYEGDDGAGNAGEIMKVDGGTVEVPFDSLGIIPNTTYEKGDLNVNMHYEGELGLADSTLPDYSGDDTFELPEFTTAPDASNDPTITATGWEVDGQDATNTLTVTDDSDLVTQSAFSAENVEFYSSTDTTIINDKLSVVDYTPETPASKIGGGDYAAGTYVVEYDGNDTDANTQVPEIVMRFKNTTASTSDYDYTITNSTSVMFDALPSNPITITDVTFDTDYRSAVATVTLDIVKDVNHFDPTSFTFSLTDGTNTFDITPTYSDGDTTASLSITGINGGTPLEYNYEYSGLTLTVEYNDGYKLQAITKEGLSFTTKDIEIAEAPKVTSTTTATSQTEVKLTYNIDTAQSNPDIHKAIVNKVELSGEGIDPDTPIVLDETADGTGYTTTVTGLVGSTEYSGWTLTTTYDNGRGTIETVDSLVNTDGIVKTAEKEVADAPIKTNAVASGNGHGGRIEYSVEESVGTDSKWGSSIKNVNAEILTTTTDDGMTPQVSDEVIDGTPGEGSFIITGLNPKHEYAGIVEVTYTYINAYNYDGSEKSTATFKETYNLTTLDLIGVDSKPTLNETGTSFEAVTESTGNLTYSINTYAGNLAATTPEAKGTIRHIDVVNADDHTKVYGSADSSLGMTPIETGIIELTGLPEGVDTNVVLLVDYDSEEKVGADLVVDPANGHYDLIGYELPTGITISPLHAARNPEVSTSYKTLDDDNEQLVADNDGAIEFTYKVNPPAHDDKYTDTIIDSALLSGTGLTTGPIVASITDEDGNAITDIATYELLTDGIEHTLTINGLEAGKTYDDWAITTVHHSSDATALTDVDKTNKNSIEPITTLGSPEIIANDGLTFKGEAIKGSGNADTLDYSFDYELAIPKSSDNTETIVRKTSLSITDSTGFKVFTEEFEGAEATKGTIEVDDLTWGEEYNAKFTILDSNYLDGTVNTSDNIETSTFTALKKITDMSEEDKPSVNITTGNVKANSLEVNYDIATSASASEFDAIDPDSITSIAKLYEGKPSTREESEPIQTQVSSEMNGVFEFKNLTADSDYYVIITTSYNGIINSTDSTTVNSEVLSLRTTPESNFPWWVIIVILILLILIVLLILLVVLWLLRWVVLKTVDRNKDEVTFLLNKKDSKLEVIEGRVLNSNELQDIKYTTSTDEKGNILITAKGVKGLEKLTGLTFLAKGETKEVIDAKNAKLIEAYEANLAKWTEAKAKADETGKEFTIEKPTKPTLLKVDKDIKVIGSVKVTETVKEEKLKLAKDLAGAEAQVKELEAELKTLEKDLTEAKTKKDQEKIEATEARIVTVKRWITEAKKNLVVIKQKTASKATIMID